MKLKLKESIRAKGVQYLPPSVIDTDEIGITQADADVLVRRGTAEVAEEAAVAVAAADVQADGIVTQDAAAVDGEPEAEAAAPAPRSRKR